MIISDDVEDGGQECSVSLSALYLSVQPLYHAHLIAPSSRDAKPGGLPGPSPNLELKQTLKHLILGVSVKSNEQ